MYAEILDPCRIVLQIFCPQKTVHRYWWLLNYINLCFVRRTWWKLEKQYSKDNTEQDGAQKLIEFFIRSRATAVIKLAIQTNPVCTEWRVYIYVIVSGIFNCVYNKKLCCVHSWGPCYRIVQRRNHPWHEMFSEYFINVEGCLEMKGQSRRYMRG